MLIRRSSHKSDRHSGQISLPGGRFEELDLDLEDCALREAEEEIGIDRNVVKVLGALTDLYIPISNFSVTPIVSCTEEARSFSMQTDEVDEILSIPLTILLDPDVIKYKPMTIQNGMRIPKVPYYDLNGQVLWGATAMILSEFAELMRELRYPDLQF